MGFYKLLKVLSRNSGKLGFLGFFSRSVCNTAFATALGSLFQDRHKQTPGGLPEEPRLARGSRESERARESESERARRSASSLSPSPSLSLSLSLSSLKEEKSIPDPVEVLSQRFFFVSLSSSGLSGHFRVENNTWEYK